VLAALLLALIIDVMRVGPEWLKDRVAFVIGLTAIREGFGGSALEAWTVSKLTAAIDGGFRLAGTDLYIAQADASAVVSVLIGAVALYCVGVLLPPSAAKWAGGFARLSFSRRRGRGRAGPVDANGERYQLNKQLWACAWILGLLADLPQGLTGEVLRKVVSMVTWAVTKPLSYTLFGA
jgi:hypothetical protein